MALIVQKYGGTSVGSPERILNVAQKISTYKQQGHDIVVVVSAMSGETNRLLGLAQAVSETPQPREIDVLLSTGEQVTIALLSMALHQYGVDSISCTGSQVKIVTDNVHNKARILTIDGECIRSDLAENKVVVVAGFQGIDQAGNITTLGRGGSDTTAVALAAALNASECQIFTDVDGVYTMDPRIVPNARKLEVISYDEMLEMASLGSKVLQIRAVEFASKYNVPLRVLSSFSDDTSGTLITNEENIMEQPLISGIALNKDEAKLTVIGVPDKPGVAYHILGPIADANIEVDMIIQNVGANDMTDFTFTVNRGDYDNAIIILKDLVNHLGTGSVMGDQEIVKISLVGVGMRSHAGIASKMFQTLSDEGINIMMISTSEIKISVVINEKYMELGTRVLHNAFELA